MDKRLIFASEDEQIFNEWNKCLKDLVKIM